MFQAGWLGCEHGGPGSTAVGHRMWVGPGVHGAAAVKWPQLLGLYCGIRVFFCSHPGMVLRVSGGACGVDRRGLGGTRQVALVAKSQNQS